MADDAASYVQSLYQSELGRTGEASGVDYWAGQIASGAMSRDAVANAIANSAEAKIGDIYQQELGRSGAGDSGLGYWANAVESGQMTLDEARNAIARSQEGAAYDVNRLYQSELGRGATDAGAQYWRDALMTGRLDEAGLLSGIRGSAEYQNRGTTTDTAFNADKLRAEMKAQLEKQLAEQRAAYEKQLAQMQALRQQQQQQLMQKATAAANAGSFTPTAPLTTAETTTAATTPAATTPAAAPVPATPAPITPAPTMVVPQTYLSPAPPQYRQISPFQNPFLSYFALANRQLPGMQPVAAPAMYQPVDGSQAAQMAGGVPAPYAAVSPFAPLPAAPDVAAGGAPAPMITNPALPPTA